MGLTFKNAKVVIGGETIYASQVSIDEKVDFQRADGLGFASTDIYAASRKMGTFSADFYWTKNLFDTFSMTGFTSLITGSIGATTFGTGYITELSMTAEAMSAVKGSIKGEFVGGVNWSDSGVAIPVDIPEIGHGLSSEITTHQNMFSLGLTYSRKISPIFGIRNSATDEVIGWDYGGGEIRCSLKGFGLQNGVDVCEGSNEVSINVDSLCNSVGGMEITIDGLTVTDSAITIDKNGDVVGSMELIRYF